MSLNAGTAFVVAQGGTDKLCKLCGQQVPAQEIKSPEIGGSRISEPIHHDYNLRSKPEATPIWGNTGKRRSTGRQRTGWRGHTQPTEEPHEEPDMEKIGILDLETLLPDCLMKPADIPHLPEEVADAVSALLELKKGNH